MDNETGLEWYLLHTHRKQEDRAYSNLVAWRVETMYAKVTTRRIDECTGAPITQPLFPRYIFAKFNIRQQLRQIRFTHGVHNVFCMGNNPAVVHSDIIDIIRTRIDQNGFVKIRNHSNPEDEAAINEGPLRDLIEMFEREVSGSKRSLILLTAIEYKAR